ncbi:MAG: hypothetical protein ACFCGT_13435 [Sandaracinaceae bacterium]
MSAPSVAPLHRLTAALGIPLEELVREEEAERIFHTFRVPGEKVGELTADVLDGAVAAYGEAFELTVRTGDLDELVVRGSGYSPSDLADLVAGARRTPRYDVVLHLDKAALARGMVGPADARVLLFFHGEALDRLLGQGLPSLEVLWPEPATRLLVLVLDEPLVLRGDLLSVLGRDAVGEAKAEAARATAPGLDVARARRRRDDYIGLDTDLRTRVTPWHLAVRSATAEAEVEAARAGTSGPTDGALRDRLDGLFVLLAILFTCDRARAVPSPEGPPRVQAEYRGAEHVAFVPVEQGTPVALTAEQRGAIGELLAWCYRPRAEDRVSDWLGDRLPFVQTRVAQALEGRAEADRFRVLARAMPQIVEGAKWHWRAFLEGRINRYLERVQALEGAVADAVDRYTEQVTGLVKGLSDTMLGAVATLLGSFIAAAFKDPFDPMVFRLGMLVYAGYVVLFPCLLRLSAARVGADEVHASFAAKRRRFEEVLYRDKVGELVEDRVEQARRRYRRWWVGVGLGYVALVAGAVAAAFLVPAYLVGR